MSGLSFIQSVKPVESESKLVPSISSAEFTSVELKCRIVITGDELREDMETTDEVKITSTEKFAKLQVIGDYEGAKLLSYRANVIVFPKYKDSFEYEFEETTFSSKEEMKMSGRLLIMEPRMYPCEIEEVEEFESLFFTVHFTDGHFVLKWL